MQLDELAARSRDIAATPRLLEKVALLAELLKRLAPDEIEIAVAFLSGAVRQGRVGIGGAMLAEAFTAAESTERSPSGAIQPTLDEAMFGPPGERTSHRTPLTLADVDASLGRIATLTGRGSLALRARTLRHLFRRANAHERDFLGRLLTGELRQGALAGLMHEAIASAAGISVERVQRASMLTGDLGRVAHAALIEGADALDRFGLELFRPVAPMLAQTADTIDEAIERLGGPTFEHKLDGARIQIHKSGHDVRVFSRLLNEVTPAVPEVVELVRALPARRLVLDGEAIALAADGRPHPFQVTMRRFGRRLDVQALRAELPIVPVFFDLLHEGGEDTIDLPQRERFDRLLAVAPAHVVPHLRAADAAAAEAFYDAALEAGHEGVMAKDPASPYLAGRRGAAWLKIKPAHTLDLVVLAAEWGHGRRSGWLSNLHLGAADGTRGFAMLGKTFKGMTDATLAWQTERLLALETERDGHIVHVNPELVVEIAFNDVQESPVYASGMALRFARLVRYREDKRPSDADTVETVRKILRGQTPKRRTAR